MSRVWNEIWTSDGLSTTIKKTSATKHKKGGKGTLNKKREELQENPRVQGLGVVGMPTEAEGNKKPKKKKRKDCYWSLKKTTKEVARLKTRKQCDRRTCWHRMCLLVNFCGPELALRDLVAEASFYIG